jgi:preprotein translocase subunit SecF
MTHEMKITDFMAIRNYTSGISIVLTIIAIISIAINGFKFGLDFTGGTQLELLLDRPANITEIRHMLEEEHLRSPVAVTFGSDHEVMIRTQDQMKDKGREQVAAEISKLGNNANLKDVIRPTREFEGFAEVVVITNATPEQITQTGIFSEERFGRTSLKVIDSHTHVAIEKTLDSMYGAYLLNKLKTVTGASITLRSSESVGPQVGEELYNMGGIGLLCAFALVFLYVAVQFQWKFSVGAIVSLIHDTIVTLGVFSLFQWDFDLTVLAAVLALIGYSINDTIVIFDRIRENFRKLRKMDSITIVNISMTQTLGRSIMTSMTVFLVMVVLFIFGGELLAGFSKAMLVGVVIGTYSSIYIAANTAVALGIAKEDLMPQAKEGAETDLAP